MCCGKALQNQLEHSRHEVLWQHSQQQKVNLSTSSCFRNIPRDNPSGSSNTGYKSMDWDPSSSSVTPSSGLLGTISKISPSRPCPNASLLYWTLNLLSKSDFKKSINKPYSNSPSSVTRWLMIGWLTDWLADRLTDWLMYCLTWPTDRQTDWLTYWLTDWLPGWLPDCLTDWLADWLTDWLGDWLTGWLADWLAALADWLAGWLTAWRANWLIDWLTDSLMDSPDWLTNTLTHGLIQWLTYSFTKSLTD